ncbi:hypothetical protein QR685DRAFT_448513, partial [Neurospora intermedia]
VMGLAPNKASGSNWPDLTTKTATRLETTPIDSNYGTIAPRSSRIFPNYFRQ